MTRDNSRFVYTIMATMTIDGVAWRSLSESGTDRFVPVIADMLDYVAVDERDKLHLAYNCIKDAIRLRIDLGEEIGDLLPILMAIDGTAGADWYNGDFDSIAESELLAREERRTVK